VIVLYEFQAEGRGFDFFEDDRFMGWIQPVDAAAHLDRDIPILDPVADFHFRFVSFGTAALYLAMAFAAQLGTVAALEPAGGDVAGLQHKFHQGADGDDDGFRFGLHGAGIVAWDEKPCVKTQKAAQQRRQPFSTFNN
jgi:hypothetical protein